MSTLADEVTIQVRAVGVRIADNRLYVSLSDGREVSVPLDRVGWLEWLAEATPEERAQWSIEPGGVAIYWENLEEGIEIEHLLALKPLS